MAAPVRILVAGSDAGVCGPVCESLRAELGKSVDVHAASPGEAVRRIMQERFDLVFACGLECTRKLATLTGGRPIMVVGVPSGDEAVLLSDLRGLRAAYLQRGASHFLPVHPAFDPHPLIDMVKRTSARE